MHPCDVSRDIHGRRCLLACAQHSATLPSEVGPRVTALLCVAVTGQFLCNLFPHFVVVDGPFHLPLYVDVCHYISKSTGSSKVQLHLFFAIASVLYVQQYNSYRVLGKIVYSVSFTGNPKPLCK